MRNYTFLFSLASMLLSLSSVDAFASLMRPTALSKTAIRAEVGDMPAAEIPAAPESAAPDIAAAAPDIAAAAPDAAAPDIAAPDIAAAAPDAAAAAPAVPAAVPDTAVSTDTSANIIPAKQFAPPTTAVQKPVIDLDGDVPPLAEPSTNLDTIALVVGQENYGFAIVILGEAIWSFTKAPSIDHGLKTLLPAIVAAGVLGVVSGPMVTSGDAGSVSTGLFIATGVSMLMGLCYAARLSAPFSPSPKEIPALGLLVAFAGFFSFSQNLLVDGFVTLPSIPLPSLPSFELPSIQLPF
jgi:hypothetical protein